MALDKTDKSLPALFAELTRETVDLVRKEIALARAEVGEKVSTAQAALVSLAGGGVIILAGLILVLLALANGLAMVLPPEVAPWLAPLIVGVVVMLIGYFMLRSGRSHLSADGLTPHRTVNSLRRDKAVAQEKVA